MLCDECGNEHESTLCPSALRPRPHTTFYGAGSWRWDIEQNSRFVSIELATISKGEWNQTKARIDALEQQVASLLAVNSDLRERYELERRLHRQTRNRTRKA